MDWSSSRPRSRCDAAPRGAPRAPPGRGSCPGIRPRARTGSVAGSLRAPPATPGAAAARAHLVAEIDEPRPRGAAPGSAVGAGQLQLPSRDLGLRCHRLALHVRDLRAARSNWRAHRLPGPDPPRTRGSSPGYVLVLAPAEERRERTEEPRGIAERPVLIQLEVEQVLAEEDHRFRSRQHPHVRRQPELERELPDSRSPNAWNVAIVASV